MVRYQINLVRSLREQEVKTEKQQTMITGLLTLSFGVLCVAVLYTVLNIILMNGVLRTERENLARIETEYKKYRETTMIVDKADIELLDALQNGRIFWTKKLAAMAYHLPNEYMNSYWITKFGYKAGMLGVSGYGFISQKQEQLITIDDYLNKLRADSTFDDVFAQTYLKSTMRADEGTRDRVTFEYAAVKNGVQPK